MEMVLYMPTRKSTYNRVKAIPTVGITSRIKINGKIRHFLFIDIDRELNIFKVFYQLMNIIEDIKGELPKNMVISRTKKGYHILIFYPFKWKEVLSILTRLKPYVDKKWLKLQKTRKFIIIRVAGKYNERDIRPILIIYTPSDFFSKYLIRYLRMIKYEQVSNLRGQKGEKIDKTISSRTRGTRDKYINEQDSRRSSTRIHKEQDKYRTIVNRINFLENNEYKEHNMENRETNKLEQERYKEIKAKVETIRITTSKRATRKTGKRTRYNNKEARYKDKEKR